MNATRSLDRRPRRADGRRRARARRPAGGRASACSRSAASSSPPPGPTSCASSSPAASKVFLDLKYHDIPNTVAGAVRERGAPRRLARGRARPRRPGHARGRRSARCPRWARASSPSPSSRATTRSTLGEIGVERVGRRVRCARLALLAKDAGVDGVVASPHEVAPDPRGLRARLPDRDPGHPAGGRGERATRPAPPTPAAALAAGADYLVVGRPITEAGPGRRRGRDRARDGDGRPVRPVPAGTVFASLVVAMRLAVETIAAGRVSLAFAGLLLSIVGLATAGDAADAERPYLKRAGIRTRGGLRAG